MSEELTINSNKGEYTVEFDEESLSRLNGGDLSRFDFLVDKKVAGLYAKELDRILDGRSTLLIEAKEENKSLDKFPLYVEHLVSRGVRKNHILVAIGGGVIQDIVCFFAATLLRGLNWHFYPTTLLAQADSCIGSKSSINVGKIKNILGTFTPPEKIYICTHLLKTLEEKEVRSGTGEMLKVHAIDGPESFDRIAADYDGIMRDYSLMRRYIRKSLEIKKGFIEIDEFDRGPRNVLNYGHSFGHAIESATDFAVPHGIAVSMGADMANFIATRLGITEGHYERMHPAFKKNYAGFENVKISIDDFFSALSKDKKNTDDQLRLVLPDVHGRPTTGLFSKDQTFIRICEDYFRIERHQ